MVEESRIETQATNPRSAASWIQRWDVSLGSAPNGRSSHQIRKVLALNSAFLRLERLWNVVRDPISFSCNRPTFNILPHNINKLSILLPSLLRHSIHPPTPRRHIHLHIPHIPHQLLLPDHPCDM